MFYMPKNSDQQSILISSATLEYENNSNKITDKTKKNN